MNFSINVDLEHVGPLDDDDYGDIPRLTELAAAAAHAINLNLPDDLRISGVNVSSYPAMTTAPGEELVTLDANEVRLHEVPFDPEVTP